MAAVVKQTTIRSNTGFPAWLPPTVMPAAVVLLFAEWPPWIFMWALAISIYAGLKWTTFADCPASGHASLSRSLGYLLLWPGMDAATFLSTPEASSRPRTADWLFSAGELALGFGLVFAVAPAAHPDHPLLVGWIGMIGLVFVLHFGLFQLLSLGWRRFGVNALPIMNEPMLASSLSDLWGRRWNLAFRDLAHTYVFRPHVRQIGTVGAMVAVFLVSGVVHDLVISVPARGGWGRPTLYFLIQGTGLLLERSRLGRWFGLGRAVPGRLFCAAVTLLPLPLLFHRPFIERVVLPMLAAVGAV